MAIKLDNVTKRFGNVTALDGVTASFGENKIYGLLGNNGAGKSTLLNIITNRLYADGGSVTIDDLPCDSDEALGRLFMVGEQNLFPDDMRVKKAMHTVANFYPNFDMALAESTAQQFALDTRKKITALSTGYASIFRLVLGLAANTPYLIFDEPVLGLDAQHRDLFYRLLIEKYAAAPCTVIVSTHLIQEVASLIEHTLIIKDGRIIRDMPADALAPAGLQDYFIRLMNGEEAI